MLRRREPRSREELTITTDYVFREIFSDPELCRKLLERILGFGIRKVVVTHSERALEPSPDEHGIRLDVYAEDDAQTIYDVEMQTTNRHDLALRSRYYSSLIDSDILDKGVRYRELRRVIVIFICTFDPVGEGLPRYEFVPTCRETGTVLDDRTTRILVNTTAWRGCREPRLQALLHYLQSGTIGDEFTGEIDAEVQRIRAGREASMWVNHAHEWDLEDDAREEQAELTSQLCDALEAEGRVAEIPAIMRDRDLFDRMLIELGIVEPEE